MDYLNTGRVGGIGTFHEILDSFLKKINNFFKNYNLTLHYKKKNLTTYLAHRRA